MAKNMARIENNIVINMEWCSDWEPQTETLIDVFDRPVGIEDTYDGENFFRGGVKVLTPFEEMQAELLRIREENAAMQAERADMMAALNVLGVAE